MNNNNYICLQGFMLADENLKGNDLILYALIYGFVQDGETEYYASLNYMSEALHLTKRGVQKILQRLVDMGYLEAEEKEIWGAKRTRYRAIVKDMYASSWGVNKVRGGGEKSSPSGEKSSPNNNIYIYNNNNNKYSAKTKSEREQAFAEKCKPYREKYGDAMVDKFIYYWTEGENKMRYEKQDVFEVGRRLATWAQRDAERNPQPQPQEPKKHLSVDEIMKKHYGIE